MSVKLVLASRGPIQAWVFAEGTARSSQREYLTFEATGRVTFIGPKKTGTVVKKGEVLATLDKRTFAADVDAALAQIEEAKTQVEASDADDQSLTLVLPIDTASNEPPTAVDDLYTTVQGMTLTVDAASGLLANDFDGDGDQLSAMAGAGPVYGNLVVNPDGSLVYTPDKDFVGTETISYSVEDELGESATANLIIVVTPAASSPPTVESVVLNGRDDQTDLGDRDTRTDPKTDLDITTPANVLPINCSQHPNLDPSRPQFWQSGADTANASDARGFRWGSGFPVFTTMNTMLPPNSPSCVSEGAEDNTVGGGVQGANDAKRYGVGFLSPSSRHQGGVHILMGDGAVKFVTDSIESGDGSQPPVHATGPAGSVPGSASPYGLWGSLGTRASKEVIQDEF